MRPSAWIFFDSLTHILLRRGARFWLGRRRSPRTLTRLDPCRHCLERRPVAAQVRTSNLLCCRGPSLQLAACSPGGSWRPGGTQQHFLLLDPFCSGALRLAVSATPHHFPPGAPAGGQLLVPYLAQAIISSRPQLANPPEHNRLPPTCCVIRPAAFTNFPETDACFSREQKSGTCQSVPHCSASLSFCLPV